MLCMYPEKIFFLFLQEKAIIKKNSDEYYIYIYRVQSKVVRRPSSLQPLVADANFQLQNWLKKCQDLCYGIFKFQKSIL